ncbi:MAG TPA: N-acetyl-alpha-D-glucosaminyl L-malate synthase BshA [Vicinamibacterales bacterium]|jgi:N-acetyl-alpha-D-glucosaminyl L-malate synthase BshA
MNVGIVCYASVGGSGILATELGKTLAMRGHRVHILSSDMPVRLGDYQPGLWFHRVETPSYPLFREPQYLLSLANKIVQVARDERLDIVHAHYAIPHATAANLARQVLASTTPAGERVPRVITTLHGTDITLLGADRSYSEIVAFGISQSDGVTAVSESLKADTIRELGVRRDIRVVPNFVDVDRYQRRDVHALREQLAPRGEKLLIHISNFRPVKRVTTVVDVFSRVHARIRSRLLMVGDGPDLNDAVKLARHLGVFEQVDFVGEQDLVVPLLSAADAFLLPSAQESFGLAALEAMACEVPVVASRVGGIPEVVQHGVSGFLHAPDDLDGMADSTVRMLEDQELHRRIALAARRTSVERFSDSQIVPLYESSYEEALLAPSRA